MRAESHLSFLTAFIMGPIINKIDEVILLIVLSRLRMQRQLEEMRSSCRYRTHPLLSQQFSSGYFVSMFFVSCKNILYFFFMQMSVVTFDELLQWLEPRLSDNHMRMSVSP